MPSPQVSSGTEPVTMKSCTAPNLGQLFTARVLLAREILAVASAS